MANEVKYEWGRQISTNKVASNGGNLTIDPNPHNLVFRGTVDFTEAQIIGEEDLGNVTGPESSINNGIPRFSGATGKIIKDSLVTINDTGSINLPDSGMYSINNVPLINNDTLQSSILYSSLTSVDDLTDLQIDNISIWDDIILITNDKSRFSISANRSLYRLDISRYTEQQRNLVSISNQGTLYAHDIHNNAGAHGSPTSEQELRSGTTNTPLVAVTGCTIDSFSPRMWMRVGNVVTVSGACTITTNSGPQGAVRFQIPIDVPSNFSNDNGLECSGNASLMDIGEDNLYTAKIRASAADNVPIFEYINDADDTYTVNFIFTYRCIA